MTGKVPNVTLGSAKAQTPGLAQSIMSDSSIEPA